MTRLGLCLLASLSLAVTSAAAQIGHNHPSAPPMVGSSPPPPPPPAPPPPPSPPMMVAPAPPQNPVVAAPAKPARHPGHRRWRSKAAEYRDCLHRYGDRAGCRYLVWRHRHDA